MEPGRRRLVASLIRLVGPVVLVVVIWRAGLGELLAVVASADLTALAGAVALNGVALHLKVIRWRSLLRERGHDYPLSRSYLAVLSSLYLGMVTPGRVGDLLRVQYVRHEAAVPYRDGLATTVMDRFCDLYVLAGFAAGGIAYFASLLPGSVALAGWVTVAIALLSPLVFFVPGLAEGTFGRIHRRLVPAHEEGLGPFLSALRGLLGPRLGYAVVLSVLAFATNYLQGWLIAGAIAAGIGFIEVVGLLAVTSLLGLMPISISGVGVRELFLALVFPALGSSSELGVAFGLLVFASMYLPLVLAGFIAWQLAPPPVGRQP
jgi:glycosyltransferase 2 family protein